MKKCLICQNSINESINLLNLFNQSQNICQSCQLNLTFNHNVRRCTKCLKILSEDEHECLDCMWLSQSYKLINQLHTLYDYQTFIKTLMHQYKFSGDLALYEIFQIPRKIIKNYDLIVPAPINDNKLRNRTFDHVAYVLDKQNIPYTQLFQTEERKKQACLSKKERSEQNNPFKLIDEINLENKKILLVDDIYTTGLTIHQLAEHLFVRKIRKLDALTFARG